MHQFQGRRQHLGLLIVLALLAGLVAVLPAPVAAAPAGATTTRVSVGASGSEGDGPSYAPAVSTDGRFITFTSAATNLVDSAPHFTNVYRKDRKTGAVELINLPFNAVEQGRSHYRSDQADLSADGNIAVFVSDDPGLVASDTNDAPDVFLRDLRKDTTRIVSLSSNGDQTVMQPVSAAKEFGALRPSLSRDGRFVSFTSVASNLGGTAGLTNVYHHDTRTGETILISQGANGPGDGDSFASQVSADGGTIAFTSSATNLVSGSGDSDGGIDVFLRRPGQRTTTLISRGSLDGEEIVGGGPFSLSANASVIAYEAHRVGRRPVVVVLDLATESETVLVLDPEGRPDHTVSPSVSDDGRYIAFGSDRDEDKGYQVFLRDQDGGPLLLVSVDDDGVPAQTTDTGGTGNSEGSIALSGDGRSVAFVSTAGNLVPGDTNRTDDIFIRDAAFDSSTTSSTATSFTTAPSTTTTPPPEILDYVALGDSFSSGEGTFLYDRKDQNCHRGPAAWPRVLDRGSERLKLISHRACTGATTGDLVRTRGKGRAVGQIPSNALPAVDVVTVTIGGNDVGFGNIVVECRIADCSGTPQDSRFLAKLNVLSQNLRETVYPALKRAYPNARIIHVGYPGLVPPPRARPVNCGWLSKSEQDAGRTLVGLLNVTIKEAAAAFPGIEYVDATDVLKGHELCTRKSWVTPISQRRFAFRSEQGHPDYRGQKAYAATVADAIDLD